MTRPTQTSGLARRSKRISIFFGAMGFLTFSPQKPAFPHHRIEVHSSEVRVLQPGDKLCLLHNKALKSPQLSNRHKGALEQSKQEKEQQGADRGEEESAELLRQRSRKLLGGQLLNTTQASALVAVASHFRQVILPQLDNYGLLRPAEPFYWTAYKSLSPSQHLNDEQLLLCLKFCYARDFNVPNVKEFLTNYTVFRSKLREEKPRINLRDCYPGRYHGVTKKGEPLYLDQPARIDIKTLTAHDPQVLEDAWIYSYEYMQQVILPCCSLAAGRRISRGVTIMDLEGVGISTFNAKTRGIMSRMIKISQDYYPETMEHMYIIRAPFIFNAIWRFVKGLLDKATVEKIHVLSQRGESLRQELLKFIDEESIPPFLTEGADSAVVQGELLDLEASRKLKLTGPWTNPDILAQLHNVYPNISSHLVDYPAAEPPPGSNKLTPLPSSQTTSSQRAIFHSEEEEGGAAMEFRGTRTMQRGLPVAAESGYVTSALTWCKSWRGGAGVCG
eukprot:Protomagalhaensia_wolfi_Nauph_80__2526@NODE_268_length_2993_cov_162_800609_g200_i0_p1_GENE_NODE_268_length_2993_cov_162_800609_g200_i0NODE_268_length_2993_cov_162_800609_g200_i0_p1_ORF_typecomplete_len502_score74_00CRAL_TRIO/PF00650_20/2_2e35_NODE_268_length_2993_cov_162_800609_g200_i014282933